MQGTVDSTRLYRRNVFLGVAVWAVFCVVAVALRGVRWDEDYEFAQVITRTISYPEGHPLFRYVRSLFSVQTYSLAALLFVTKSPVILCGIRNVLFLMATVFPAFFIGTSLTRRTLWGHVAAATVLLGTHLTFYSTYPQYVWPQMYSNGHIGMGYALLVVWALSAGFPRAGCFLLGLMPCVHLGQWPPVLMFAALYTMWRRFRDGAEWPWRNAVGWTGAGLAVSAAVWCIVRSFSVPDPTSGPYFSAVSPEAVWLGYMARYAPHRSIPWDTGHIPLIALPILGLAVVRREARNGRPVGVWGGVLAYGVCVAVIVWGIMVVQMVMGPRVPYLLITWMPYRLMNHVPPLLLIMSVAVLAGEENRTARGAFLVAAALCYGIVNPWLRPLVGDAFHARYIATGIGVFFVLYGAAVMRVALDLKRDRRFVGPWLAACTAGWLALASRHQFGAACCAAGGWAALLAEWPLGRLMDRLPMRALAAGLAAATVVTLTYREWQTREHLPVSPFERRVAAYLEEQGQPDAMLVASYEQETLQARTRHPIMADMATITWIAYKPSLGPTMDKLYGDIWGVHFAPHPDPGAGKAWFERWAERRRGDWQALAETYAFEYVIAPNFVTLDLPRVVKGKNQSLYRIPAGARTL